jgi:hypothetical protein
MNKRWLTSIMSCIVILMSFHDVLRHVMHTIVDRYDNEREIWSKSSVGGGNKKEAAD